MGSEASDVREEFSGHPVCVQSRSLFAGRRNLGRACTTNGDRAGERRRRCYGSNGTSRRGTSSARVETRTEMPGIPPLPPSHFASSSAREPRGKRGTSTRDGDTRRLDKANAANNVWHIFEITRAAPRFLLGPDEFFSWTFFCRGAITPR